MNISLSFLYFGNLRDIENSVGFVFLLGCEFMAAMHHIAYRTALKCEMREHDKNTFQTVARHRLNHSTTHPPHAIVPLVKPSQSIRSTGEPSTSIAELSVLLFARGCFETSRLSKHHSTMIIRNDVYKMIKEPH